MMKNAERPKQFQLFYISTTDHIASTTFGGRTWSDMKPFNSFLGYRAAPHSRHLSAVSIRNAMPNPYNNLTDIHLYFENILGYVTLLHTVQNNNNLSGPRNYEHKLWSNFSDYLYVDEKGPSYTVPISCKSWSSSSSSDTAYSLIVMDTAVTTDGADPPLYGNPTVIEFSHTPSNGSKYSCTIYPFNLLWWLRTDFSSNNYLDDVRRLSQGSPIFASQYIKNSDIAIISDGTAFSVWVENAKLVQLELGEGAKTRPMPQASFPFTRLASASHNIRSPTTFLYHQIDGSTFAEEQWDDSVQFWLSPVNISV